MDGWPIYCSLNKYMIQTAILLEGKYLKSSKITKKYLYHVNFSSTSNLCPFYAITICTLVYVQHRLLPPFLSYFVFSFFLSAPPFVFFLPGLYSPAHLLLHYSFPLLFPLPFFFLIPPPLLVSFVPPLLSSGEYF